MFVAIQFVIAENEKQCKYPKLGEWLNKLCCIHSLRGYYSILKNNIYLTGKENPIIYMMCKEEITKQWVQSNLTFVKKRKEKKRKEKNTKDLEGYTSRY